MTTATLSEIRPLQPPVSMEPKHVDARADDGLYEVVFGKRVELPPMSTLAVLIASLLQEFLGIDVRQNKLGRVLTESLSVLDEETDLRRRPDVAFVSAQTWPLDRLVPSVGDWAVVPDLAVEVNSPNDVMDNVISKISEYFKHGVREVWLILPRHGLVYVYSSPTQVRILTAKEELANTIVPGFRLNLAELFRESAKA